MGGLTRRDVVFTISMLALFFGLGWLSYLTRPSDEVASSWWPAAGVALGIGLRLPRRFAVAIAPVTGILSVPLGVAITGSLPLTSLLAVAVALETYVGVVILRGRSDTTPQLAEVRDITRLLVAVFAAAIVFDVSAALAQAIVSGEGVALFALSSAAARHAAGMLLVAPLFMQMASRSRSPHLIETVVQVITTLVIAGLVFVFNDGLPLAFLPFVPLVWAALRSSTRLLLIEIIAVSSIASYGSAGDHGPFSFARFGAVGGSELLQVFQLAMVIVFLALSLAVTQEQTSRKLLAESERLFRSTFDAAFEGIAILARVDGHWRIQRANAAAARMLPVIEAGSRDLAEVIGAENAATLVRVGRDRGALPTEVPLELADGRHFDSSLASLGSGEEDSYLLQLIDVTDSFRARQFAEDEFERAAQIQRALTPATLPALAGWQYAAVSSPARQVGGDFYDLRLDAAEMALVLGDVMGKGVAAGMLAASARTALRSASTRDGAAGALASADRLLADDLARSESFITLVLAVVDLEAARVRLVDAGHGLTFVLRADGTLSRVASSDLPWGIGTEWVDETIAVGPGDALLLVSDGVMDAWGGTVESLQEGIAVAAMRAEGDPRALIESLCSSAADTLDRDDVTAVILRRDPSTSS